MKHFLVRGILNPDWVLCGAPSHPKDKGETTVDRDAVDCPKCRSGMDTDKPDRKVLLEGLHFMAERGYPEAATLAWELIEANKRQVKLLREVEAVGGLGVWRAVRKELGD